MNKPVLVSHDLGKTYVDGTSKIEVLRKINLEVMPGEMLAVIGASGSGKSTLLHLLAGLDKPTNGYVILKEQRLDQLNEKNKCYLRNHYLGFVYQYHHLLPEFTALENVGIPLLIRNEDPRQIKEKASDLLTQVGLEARLQHRVNQLSGGERQRVAIARALITNPLCILADEPTGNLDPKNAERVLQLFFNLQAKVQTSVVMVTHDPAIANEAKLKMKIEEGFLIPA